MYNLTFCSVNNKNMIFALLIILPIVLIGSTFAKSDPSTLQVKMVVELFRHGARAPVDQSFNLPWVKQFGYGELTDVGRRMHYNLGLEMRLRYPTIFDRPMLRSDEYWVRSTPVNRTLESAFSHITGLFDVFSEKEFDQEFFPNSDIRLQPP